MNLLVSVIIPTYNRANLIGETLDSVIMQSYPNWECIVVDDGSTDNTKLVMEAYCKKDKRIQYHHRPKDRQKGGNAARNYGFELSKGDYVKFLDSDDLLHLDNLKIKMELIAQHGSDVVISKHTNRKEDLLVAKSLTPIFYKNHCFDIDFILSRNTIITSDPLIKREAMAEVVFDEDLRRFQDHEFFIRLFRQKLDICYIENLLYFHRLEGSTIGAQVVKGNKEMIDNQIAIHKEMLDYYAKEPSVLLEYRRKARKMYVGFMKTGNIARVLENYHFFRKSFSLSTLEFTFFFMYNLLFRRGYDKIMYRIKKN